MSSSSIVQFKAGRVDYDEETKQATPKRGQGLVKVTKNPDDPSLFSFSWEPRGKNKNAEKDELLLFPGDASWTHVTECDTGRVFALNFKTSGQRILFWMQSPVDSGKSVNELTSEDNKIGEQLTKILDEDSLIEDADAPATTVETPSNRNVPDPATSSTTEESQLTQGISDVLQSIQTNQQQQQGVPIMSINDVFPVSSFISHVNNLSEQELEPLYAHIPEGLPKTKEELIRIIQSSQFAQGEESLGQVLNNNGVGSIVAGQLGYTYNGEGIEGFLRGAKQQGDKEKKDDDNQMDED